MPQILNVDDEFETLVAWIRAQLESGVRLFALEGFCGRGKSRLAQSLCAATQALSYLDGDLFAIREPDPCLTWRDWMRCDALQADARARLDAGAVVLVDSAVAWGALGDLTATIPAVRMHLRALQFSGIHTDDLEYSIGVEIGAFDQTLCDTPPMAFPAIGQT